MSAVLRIAVKAVADTLQSLLITCAYRGGVYYHSEEQRQAIEESIQKVQQKYTAPIVTEVKPATTFYAAEDYHQQYLEKGGQVAKKQAAETIRCYG
jgi:peptide-methionine (S)-S-oxide reductase